MSGVRPRLFVVGGPSVDPGSLESALGDRFEVVVIAPEQLAGVEQDPGGSAVLADLEELRASGCGPLSGQARVLINAISEGLCLFNDDGELVWSNEHFGRLDERVRERVAGVCRQAVESFRSRGVDGSVTARSRRYSLSFRRRRRYFDVFVSPVFGEDGVLTHAAAIVRDVSSRRRMQQKIDAIDRAGRELVHIESDVITSMHAQERLGLLEEKIIRYAHELMRFDHFAVRLLNEHTNALDLVMSKGLPQEARDIELFAEPEDNGISGYVASTGRSYICHDASSDELYVLGIPDAGSSLTVPLRLFDRVIGIFDIESADVGAFTETDRQFAEIFGNYIALALHMLNLLVVERYTTRQSATGAVEGELSEPLNDLVAEAQLLKDEAGSEETAAHVERILRDVESIRRRMKAVAAGPRSLLGAEAALQEPERDPVLTGRRILVVDNDETSRETVTEILRRRGATVVACEDGTGAVTLLNQWAATFDASEGFDLVMSDISLGDKTGYDVFASAKRADEAIPVILMTGFGYDPHHSIVRASQEGLQCVLFKPFQAQRMVDEVKRALAPEQGAASPREEQSN